MLNAKLGEHAVDLEPFSQVTKVSGGTKIIAISTWGCYVWPICSQGPSLIEGKWSGGDLRFFGEVSQKTIEKR